LLCPTANSDRDHHGYSTHSVVEVPGVRIAPGSSESAPFIYFDGVPTFGIRNGAIQIELAANTILPDGKGVKIEVVMTAHLRCSPAAASSLRETIDKALALLQQEQQQVADPAQGSKPN
jgi:hypothetical protein